LVPLLLLYVFEVCLGDLLRTAQEERALLDQNGSDVGLVCANALLLVKVLLKRLEALSHDVATDEQFLFEEP